MTRKRFVVRGRVQGVGFRWHAMEAARLCGVTGWVSNRPDGSVEAEAQGTSAAVAGFASALRKGPRFASVESVDEREIAVAADETIFDIR